MLQYEIYSNLDKYSDFDQTKAKEAIIDKEREIFYLKKRVGLVEGFFYKDKPLICTCNG